jgi:hypothetical protein
MEPDAGDLAVGGLTHHIDRHVGVRRDHDGIELCRHTPESGKTRDAFDL